MSPEAIGGAPSGGDDPSRRSRHGGPSDRGGLVVRGAEVRFGDLAAVGGVDLAVAPGEVVALVGPSGCGKSTLLRFVAGLERGRGTVSWGGDDLTRARPDRRRFGLMFQDHALFANRSVADNVAFGLEVAGVRGAARAERVAAMLDLVGLAGHGDRAVDTLSGGEAQRVALARALAPSPRLLMLDEPLGSLDRTLRERLAVDLRHILTETGVAAIHVTHDQEEAYAVADRLVVMRAGRVERDGPAAQVWADPGTAFVARFLGHRNVLDPAQARALGLLPPPGFQPAAVGLPDDRGTTGDAPDGDESTEGRSGDRGSAVAATDGHTGPAGVVVREAAITILEGTTSAVDPAGSAVEPGGSTGPDRDRSAGAPGPGPAGAGPAPVHEARVVEVRFRGAISQVDLRVGPVDLRVHTPRPPAPGTLVRLVIDPAQVAPLTA